MRVGPAPSRTRAICSIAWSGPARLAVEAPTRHLQPETRHLMQLMEWDCRVRNEVVQLLCLLPAAQNPAALHFMHALELECACPLAMLREHQGNAGHAHLRHSEVHHDDHFGLVVSALVFSLGSASSGTACELCWCRASISLSHAASQPLPACENVHALWQSALGRA